MENAPQNTFPSFMAKTRSTNVTLKSTATFGFIDLSLTSGFIRARSWGGVCRQMNFTHQEDSGVSPMTFERERCLPAGRLDSGTILQTLNVRAQCGLPQKLSSPKAEFRSENIVCVNFLLLSKAYMHMKTKKCNQNPSH